MRILIIDDDVDLRNLLERYIKQQWTDSQVDQYDSCFSREQATRSSRCAP